MRIVIDARWIFEELSGIGIYTQALVKHLATSDRENEYILLFQHRTLETRTDEATRFNTAPNFRSKLVNYGPLSIKNQFLLPGWLSDERADVFHSPNYMIPYRSFPVGGGPHTKAVVTIHDLIPLIFPDHAPKSKKARMLPLFKRIMFETGRRASVILTVSESRNDIIKHLKIPAERADRVVAIPNGVSSSFSPGATRVGDAKNILYVGRLDPYKNVVRLIEAYARVRDELPHVSMTLVGPEDGRYPEPRQLARKLGVEEHIRWLGYLPDERLMETYQEADVLVLPSRYEGFGLPVVEAMACGTPVICSNSSSLPEVAGDAAILFDPDNTGQLVDALTRVLTETALVRTLREKGILQAAHFTWNNTADATRQAYELALGG